jgi:hypothetical protein
VIYAPDPVQSLAVQKRKHKASHTWLAHSPVVLGEWQPSSVRKPNAVRLRRMIADVSCSRDGSMRLSRVKRPTDARRAAHVARTRHARARVGRAHLHTCAAFGEQTGTYRGRRHRNCAGDQRGGGRAGGAMVPVCARADREACTVCAQGDRQQSPRCRRAIARPRAESPWHGAFVACETCAGRPLPRGGCRFAAARARAAREGRGGWGAAPKHMWPTSGNMRCATSRAAFAHQLGTKNNGLPVCVLALVCVGRGGREGRRAHRGPVKL